MKTPLLAFGAGLVVWFVLRAGWQVVGAGAMAGPFASGLMFFYLAVLCLRPLRDYAGPAYGLVAFVMIFHPAFVLGLGVGVFGADLAQLRGWSTLGTSIVGLGVLMAAMGRLRVDLEQEIARRCQAEALLREVNATLEVRVKDRTAELEDLVSDLESFNRMVSHDLRGPLGGVQGVIDLALQSLQAGDNRRVQRYLELIRAEAERLGRLVDQLLMLARVTQAQLERCETPLSEILDQALDTLRLSHGAEAVASVVALPLPSATVDAVLLRQVFINLVGNALKFAGRQACPEVLISSVDSDQKIVVEVRDNGPGFAPEQAKELFQPFKRLHGAEVPGSGIGLTIVRRIIERHGGNVWAEGRPGAGASFFFSLPV